MAIDFHEIRSIVKASLPLPDSAHSEYSHQSQALDFEFPVI